MNVQTHMEEQTKFVVVLTPMPMEYQTKMINVLVKWKTGWVQLMDVQNHLMQMVTEFQMILINVQMNQVMSMVVLHRLILMVMELMMM